MEEEQDHRDHDHHEPDDNHVGRSSRSANRSGGGPPATPRWNPTKEQINMLEGLYRQGIRTPSAEQIQQITTRLRAFGHIEGKNVFYWFQNHKARQRQKQKQESLAYVNRFLHRSSPTTHSIFPSSTPHRIPCPNVVCGPYYVPVPTQTDPKSPIESTFHQPQQTKLFPVPNATRVGTTLSRSSPRLEKFSQRTPDRIISSPCGSRYERMTVDFGGISGRRTKSMTMRPTSYNNKSFGNNHETLSLFPLSPTGGFPKRDDHEEHHDDHGFDQDQDNNISTRVTTFITSECEVEDACDQPFYDFFSR